MKNFKKLFTFLLAISIVFTACNKDTSLTKVKNIDPTEQKILNFKEKMKTGDKSGETMTIEDAVWNIEAALNYTHCNTGENEEVIGINSVFVTVNVSDDGEMNFNDITTVYNQLNADLVNMLGGNTMRVADIEFVETTDKSGEQNLKLTVVETKGGFTHLTTFGPDDYWRFSELKGKCDGSFFGTKDAVTQLNVKANAMTAYPNGHVYVTDVEEICHWDIYWIADANYCCEPSQLNEWLSDGKADVVSYKPANKSVLSYEFWQDVASGNNTTYGLTVTGHYGIWHISSTIED